MKILSLKETAPTIIEILITINNAWKYADHKRITTTIIIKDNKIDDNNNKQ